MSTFICSPQIIVKIGTIDETYDVSDDISLASVNRRLGVSSFSLTLSNRGRKYDGLFSPMDRVAIYLRRVGPAMLVMTGYLDGVPAFSTYGGSVRLRGSCTLKRLQHWMWDPTTMAANELLMQPTELGDQQAMDGGLARRTIEVLNTVTNWPKEQIHIGAIPDQWFNDLSVIAAESIKEAEIAAMINEVGGMGYVGGTSPQAEGLTRVPGIGPGTGVLQGTIMTLSRFGGKNGAAGTMELTGEPIRRADNQRAEWGGEFYVQGRWPYKRANGDPEPGSDQAAAKEWWKNKKMLLVNPRTNLAVVVRAAHWGPLSGGKGQDTTMAVSQAVWDALGAKPGHTAHLAFAPEALPLGPRPTTAPPQMPGSPPQMGTPGLMPRPGPIPGPNRYGRPPHPIGATFGQLNDFLHWLNNNGYHVGEHPDWGGIHPTAHNPTGFHHWPTWSGGAAADITWPGPHDEEMRRRLDIACREAALRGLGFIWRSANHWTHMHVDIAVRRWLHQPMRYATISDIPPSPAIDNPGTVGDIGGGWLGGVIGGGGGGGGAVGGVVGGTVGSPDAMGSALYQMFQWVRDPQYSPESELLGGVRALMNDVPIYNTIDEMMKAGLRDWCSAPNGDIIGWFPDYFGRWGTSAKMVIEPIEVKGDGFSVEWSDDRLKTHMFVTGASTSTGGWLTPGVADARTIHQMMTTAGVASVEFPELMKALFDVNPDDFRDGGKGFLHRFGARPDFVPMNNISGPNAEFFFAVQRFMRNWSDQYAGKIPLTFMPELYPGMIAAFPHWGVQGYVRSVSHNIDMNTDSGFSTTAEITSWSTIGEARSSVRNLPKGGTL